MSSQTDLEALQALEADVPELEQIEKLHKRFNVFETIGFISDEVMHSRFLAYLLDPQQSHGLGDVFLKEVLGKAPAASDGTLPNKAFENLASRDMKQTLVLREIHTGDGRIDLLLVDEANELAVIIENKIWSSESANQLKKYHQTITDQYLNWDVIGIYLTPFGTKPSHKSYVPFSYMTICELLDSTLNDEVLDDSVRQSVEHYVQMVWRNIVGDPEVEKLCQQIYRKHKRALDLIYEHRLEVQGRIQSVVEDLIRQELSLVHDQGGKPKIKIGVRDWDAHELLTSTGWTKSGRILLFEVWNYPGNLDLHLFIGPGSNRTRERLLGMAGANPELFRVPKNRNGRWLRIFTRNLLEQEAYEDLDHQEREQEIRRQWEQFLEKDFSRIREAISKESWIWESNEPAGGASKAGNRFVWQEGDVEIRKPEEDEG